MGICPTFESATAGAVCLLDRGEVVRGFGPPLDEAARGTEKSSDLGDVIDRPSNQDIGLIRTAATGLARNPDDAVRLAFRAPLGIAHDRLFRS